MPMTVQQTQNENIFEYPQNLSGAITLIELAVPGENEELEYIPVTAHMTLA